MINGEDLEMLVAEWDCVPDMCIDYDGFCESITYPKSPKDD